MVLKAIHVGKTIKKTPVLKDINVCFESGKIYGIVGRNGSGKTMLFRALSGLIKLTEGEVYLDDKKLGDSFSVLPGIGMIIENTEMYGEFTGYYNLKLLADIRGVIGKKEIEEALLRVGLDPHDKKIVRKYSLGMKQKLAIAQAIMEKPDILFLDEPTNGLDEDSVEKVRTIILKEKERGALVLLASHNREDIEKMADEIYGMRGGVLFQEEEKNYEI